ncbi:L,D-transpeptidase family protein [Kitasatospora sp. NPDC054939]
MSGTHGASAYPSYDPMYEPMPEGGGPVHEAPCGSVYDTGYGAGYDAQQAPYDLHEQSVYPDRQPFGVPQQAGYQDRGDWAQEGWDAYDDPFGAHRPEPDPVVLAASAEAAAAVPLEGRARGHRRKPKKKRHGKAVTAGTALLLAATAGWYAVGQDGDRAGVTTADGPGPDPVAAPDAQPSAPAAAPQAAADVHTEAPRADRGEARADGSVPSIPGVGPAFLAKIPADTTQVVLASGQEKNANRSTVTLWTRTPEGRWTAGESWQGHNAYRGWTTDHNEGDLRSPIGVFSLTDAGGRKADPGSKLPYDKDPLFVVSGTGFAGEPLAGSFDYVVAINYNRVAGNSPLDARRPNGSRKGGGIWLHVDHGGPTHGCISVPEANMAELIRLLDPAAKPVIVMGDATSLAA